MKKLMLCVLLILIASLVSFAQESVKVIAIRANLRGTPDTKGLVVTTVNQGESFELIKQKGAWFLIQTPKYVGWVHGSALELDKGETYTVNTPNTYYEQKPRPRTTVILESQGDSPFTSEYVGGTTTTVLVKNDSYKNMTFQFGGVTYTIAANTSKTLEIDSGTYDYSASAPGVRTLSGSAGFKQGHYYSWRFFIVTRRY